MRYEKKRKWLSRIFQSFNIEVKNESLSTYGTKLDDKAAKDGRGRRVRSGSLNRVTRPAGDNDIYARQVYDV